MSRTTKEGNLMNTMQIDCFLEAAKCKSFSTAASRLFVSQPTLSRNIALLEKELGLTLFLRNSFRGIDLTESGKIMMEAFSSAKRTTAAALTHALEIENSKTIHMTLGLLEGQLLDDKLGALLDSFKQSYPNIKINIQRASYQVLMQELRSDEIALVFMPAWQFAESSGLSIYHVCDIETVLVIPKRLIPHIDDGVHSLREFEKYPIVSADENESRISCEMLQHLCQESGINPPIQYVNNLHEQIQAVEMGEAMTLINPYNSICYSPNVNCVKVKELIPQPFAIAWSNDNSSEGTEYFHSFLANTGITCLSDYDE